MAHTPNVAVILAGCGHLDGAEIREAVLTLLALDQHGAHVTCLAPSGSQHHVVNHVTGEEIPGATRNLHEEASRIARVHQCALLAEADPTGFDALILPGGYGVAKNLCSFAFHGKDARVHPEVEAFIQAFFDQGKPVGAICIAPALVALVLQAMGRSATLTLGSGAGVGPEMEALGHHHVPTTSAREVVIDEALSLVTSPAYMFDDARLADLQVGIDRCVAEVLRRIKH